MTLIVTLISLLIERFFDWSHLRHWYWYTTYQRTIRKRIAIKSVYSPYLVLAYSIVPLLIVCAGTQILIQGWLYGFIRLVFDLFIILYCFGPQNLWADAYASINVPTQGDAYYAADKMKTSFGATGPSYSQSLHRHFLNTIFIDGERRVFGVLFWYVLLGPVGAVLYRSVTLSAEEMANHDVISELSQAARAVEAIVDWLPARFFTFIFALGGHFVHVLSCWRKKVLLGLNGNEILLTECGIAALGIENQQNIPEDGSTERHAIGLLDRSFVIALVIIAVIALLV